MCVSLCVCVCVCVCVCACACVCVLVLAGGEAAHTVPITLHFQNSPEPGGSSVSLVCVRDAVMRRSSAAC